MKKRIIGLFCIVLLCLGMSLEICAKEQPSLVADDADLLTDSEEEQLLEKLESIREEQQMDVVVLTKYSLYGEDVQEFADDFYDYEGYASDGILLMIVMDDSEWYITTTGFGIDAVTDAGREYMAKQFVKSLSDGDYYQGFMTYAELCDDYIVQARNGEPYDTGNLPRGSLPLFRNLLISIVTGLLGGFIATGNMKGKLKSVASQDKAANYIKNGSLKVTQSKDVFLYVHVDRKKRVQQTRSSGSSTHVSSSGNVHGGGGGRF